MHLWFLYILSATAEKSWDAIGSLHMLERQRNEATCVGQGWTMDAAQLTLKACISTSLINPSSTAKEEGNLICSSSSVHTVHRLAKACTYVYNDTNICSSLYEKAKILRVSLCDKEVGIHMPRPGPAGWMKLNCNWGKSDNIVFVMENCVPLAKSLYTFTFDLVSFHYHHYHHYHQNPTNSSYNESNSWSGRKTIE